MAEINGSNPYSSEVAALNHEIYNLTKMLEEKEKEREKATAANLQDPFDNPTEYHDYSDDYSKIVPWIKMSDYELPLDPARVEKGILKKIYNIGGWCMLFQFMAANLAALILITVITVILKAMNPDASSSAIDQYMTGSSIFAGINMLIYLCSNVGFALLGLKWSKSRTSSLIKPQNYNIGTAMKYCLIALAIWLASAYAASGIEDIFNKYGFSTQVSDMDDMAATGIGFAVMTVYSCIIAPVTEELFFRGMLLKVFSKANQRFAVFATAVFFGLAHSNLPQFTLAFLLGTFLAHITLIHNSIIPSIIVHIFINSMAAVASEIDADSMEMYMFTGILTLAAIAGLVLLIMFKSKNKLPATTPKQSRRGLALAKSSAGIIIAFGLQLIYMLLLLFTTKA